MAAAPGLREDTERTTELRIQPCGAWDFPLSRNEKVRRLLLCFEAEAKSSEQELAAIGRENEVLWARATTAEAVAMAMEQAATQQRLAAEAIAEAAKAARTAAATQDMLAAAQAAAKLQPAAPDLQQWSASLATTATPPSWNAPQPLPKLPQLGPHAVSPAGSPGPSPHACRPPPPAVPRSRRRTTIFATRGSDIVVRIPRRTAPPMSGAPQTTPESKTRMRRNTRLPDAPEQLGKSTCWDNFADGSDDDPMTPKSGSSSDGSVTSASFGNAEERRGRRRSMPPTPLTTPDGIQILVADNSSIPDAGWQGLMEDTWDDLGALVEGSPRRNADGGGSSSTGGFSDFGHDSGFSEEITTGG